MSNTIRQRELNEKMKKVEGYMRMSKRTTQMVTGNERVSTRFAGLALKSKELEQSVRDNTYENIWSRRDVQHATTADGLVSVLVDDMIVYLHVVVNFTRVLSAVFPIWSIDTFTTRGPLLVALYPGYLLLLCKSPPLTHLSVQGMPEDGHIDTVQFAGITDAAMYGPASKLDAVLLNNISFVICIVHRDLAGMTLVFKDLVWSRKLALSLKRYYK